MRQYEAKEQKLRKYDNQDLGNDGIISLTQSASKEIMKELVYNTQTEKNNILLTQSASKEIMEELVNNTQTQKNNIVNTKRFKRNYGTIIQ